MTSADEGQPSEGVGGVRRVDHYSTWPSPEQLMLDLGPQFSREPAEPSQRRTKGISWIASAVAEFHRSFGLPLSSTPDPYTPQGLLDLRAALLDEETEEFSDASARGDLIGMVDALADVVYVAYGSALSIGVDLDAVLREIHRSNMSKLDREGKPILREDGKVIKSSQYRPPAVQDILAKQKPLPF